MEWSHEPTPGTLNTLGAHRAMPARRCPPRNPGCRVTRRARPPGPSTPAGAADRGPTVPDDAGIAGCVAEAGMMVRPDPEHVLARIAAIVAATWPTSEDERQAWFALLGLPVHGEPVPGLDGRIPGSTHFAGPVDGDWPAIGWHVHRGRLVGVHWFLWAGEDEDEIRAAAESLRTRLSARWRVIDAAAGPAGGFTALWEPDGSQIDLYYHAPRDDHGPATTRGVVQLQVNHRERAAEAESEAMIADALERDRNPVGSDGRPPSTQQ